MVVNREIKRKRKVNTCINFLDDSPKRTKVHAQRKFAQGSNVSSPVITPVKEIERQDRPGDVLPEPTELLPIKRPNTEDFLTFLCFRGTPMLPASLHFFNTASMIDTRVQTDEPKQTSPKNGPIIINKSPNERPFIAFGVRKRADPIVISKQMDKKRRHALALQALRRKYQEQKMAKIRAVTISKLSEKITSKSVVRTRSVTKSEMITKKNITHKVVTTRTTIKQPGQGKVKSKMCLRSFRGRFIHHELGIRTHKKKPSLTTKRIIKTQPEKKHVVEKSSSEFSSDDDEPLVKTVTTPKYSSKSADVPRTAKKSAPGPKKPAEINYRLTRSHRMLVNNQLTTRKHAKFFSKASSSVIKSSNTKIVNNKKVMQSSRILKKRITHKTTCTQNRIQTRRLSQRMSKPVFHEISNRRQTRSEPKKRYLTVEERKLNSKVIGKKNIKLEVKDKCINKKEELKKTTTEEIKKIIKDKAELELKVEKKVVKKTEAPKFNNKDKCEGALRKVAIVKITKAESEKTNESEKLVIAKKESNKEIDTSKKLESKKNLEESIPKKETNPASSSKLKNEKIVVERKKPIEPPPKAIKKENEDTKKPELLPKITNVTAKNTKDIVDGKKEEKAEEVKIITEEKKPAPPEKMGLRKDGPCANKNKAKPENDKKIEKTNDKAEEIPAKVSATAKTKTEKSKKPDELIPKQQEKSEPKVSNSRPTRKTKEAAAIYMEILGHKLVNDAEIDDDDISIDSFPELPNVRKTEQRENELKAKAKSKANENQQDVCLAKKINKEPNRNLKENNDKIETKTKKEKTDDITPKEETHVENISPPDAKEAVQIDLGNAEETNLKSFSCKKEEEKENVTKRKSREQPSSDSDDNNSCLKTQQKQPKKEGEIDKKGPKKKPPIITEKRQTRFQTTKPFLDMSFSDSDESFTIDMKICGTIETKQVRKKPPAPENKTEEAKLPIKPENTSLQVLNKNDNDLLTKAEEENWIDDGDKSMDDSNHHSSVNRSKKKAKVYTRMRKPLDQSFSDSDEEPLSKLTQPKSNKKVEQQKPSTSKGKANELEQDLQLTGKPKRECTKRNQNYVSIFSSSDDEEKYFHGFVKAETKTLKDIRNEEEKCAHALPSDLLCKDVGRRYGKGKVNMSNEQIEKWLNDSALAGINVKKENDEMLKFGEKIPTETADLSKIKQKSEEDELKAKSATIPLLPQPTEKPLAKPLLGERKTIFRKEKTEPVKNVNAFSANNESSVYAFQAENEDTISTPFRRPSRRPSSTATSKSEDEISKFDDGSKYAGKFRLPTVVKATTTTRQDVSLVSSTEDSNSAVHDVSNPDFHPDLENNGGQKVFAKKDDEARKLSKGKLVVQKTTDSSMFPPANLLQKSKLENTKSHFKCVSNRNSDRLSETSEEFKYKIPSSPSASSSSSAKLCKRQKSRNQPALEFCTPVQVSDFPSVHCLAQMVEAPVFYPSEKEFQDPIEYIEKIRSRASKFGICRIVPPSNFKPECKVSDDMRFTAYNQYVHKMLHRWGPNFKELMAIRKYLQTQNITLTHPPWIGGMEIDLPRLYQTVQQLGGLKEVIEKKKWPKVSEAMKIPKSAQDRLTKLDDIYCKYLLPYDTLSPAEREKLFDEVETEWAKRESKTLLKVQQKINKPEIGNDSDSDPEDESEECIVKGRNMALNAFYRIARNTMSMWFKTAEPFADEVEQEFWKHVTLKNNHICVHSGSIDSGNWGYGFAVSKNSPFARHAWNLKVLTNNSGSVLRSMGPLMGVTVPTLHVGMVFSACCWYRDPHSLPWIEYLHTGANKIWYAIPDSMSEYFHSTLLKLVPNYCKNKSLWLPSDTVMIPPNLLVENGVSLSRTVQEPGQFIVVFPKVFTSSISTGYVVSESVYFAPPYWLETAQNVFDEMRNSCESSMFSLDRLLLSISLDPRSNIDVLRQIIPAVQSICDREKMFRNKLNELGLNVIEKLPLPEAPGIRKRRKLQDDNGDYECDTCHTNLFISLVVEFQDDVVYCLEHAYSQIEAKKIEIKNCKLMFTYDNTEVEQLVDKIKSTIEAKLQKRLPIKYSSLPTMVK